jgi:hypothetical protein
MAVTTTGRKPAQAARNTKNSSLGAGKKKNPSLQQENPFLDTYIGLALARHGRTHRYVHKLSEDGMMTLRDIVGFTKEEFFCRYPTSDENKEVILSSLRAYELAFKSEGGVRLGRSRSGQG